MRKEFVAEQISESGSASRLKRTRLTNKLGKEQQMRGVEAKYGAGSHEAPLGKVHLSEEKPLFSSKVTGYAVRRPRKLAKWSGTRDPLDADLPLGWCICIAHQTFGP